VPGAAPSPARTARRQQHPTLTSGRILAQNKLATGDKVNVGGTSFTVAGLVRLPGGGSPTDVYIPLARAQAIGKTGSTALPAR
jgi:hypothetical protein